MICFPLNNTDYEADALGAWFATRTRGVFSADDHFAVSTNNDMTVTVSGGLAWLLMSDYWGTVVLETDPKTLTIDTADGALARVDAICIQLDKNANLAKVTVKKGAYSPQPPVVTAPARNQDYDEIYVAAVTVRAGTTSILPTDITDLRLDETYCGVMRDGVSGIPTQALQDMWTAWFAAWKTQTDQDFEAWFDTIKGMLSEDVAGQLALEIKDLQDTRSNPNLLVNGGFDVWQELESYTFKGNSLAGYCADQWMFWSYGAGSEAATITRVNDGLHVALNGYAGHAYVHQTFPETEYSKKLAGKTVTVSFEATISTAGRMDIALKNSLSNFGNVSTAAYAPGFALKAITGNGEKQVYSLSGVVPDNINDLCVAFDFRGTNTPNAAYTIHWVKLEVGGAATPYVPENSTLELLRCQRYYRRPKDTVTTLPRITDNQYLLLDHWFNVPMRSNPTVTLYEPRNIYGPGNPEGYKFGDEGWGTANHVWVKGYDDRTGFKRVNGIGTNSEKLDSFLLADSSGVAGNSYYCHYEADARRYS